jgi:UDP-arabinose 4-epimerase
MKHGGDCKLRVLVTGGAGYIGSHVCKALAAAGMEPVTLDNLSQGTAGAVKWGRLILGDIADSGLVAESLRQSRAEAVMHFAGSTSVGESVLDPVAYYRNNVCGTLGLLDAMRQTAVRKIVFSSTSAVYGGSPPLPIPEEAPKAPINPYGRSKLMVEEILADEAAAHGLTFVALRYFNAAGADPEGDTGDQRKTATHLIPMALKAAAGETERLEIYGDDYPTPDGTCIRDYIHVSDLAAGHLLALGHLIRGGPSAILNLGAGRGVSVLEAIASIERVIGRKVPSVRRPRRPGDAPALYADPSAARHLLGFSTRLSEMDTIVDTAWRFYRKARDS